MSNEKKLTKPELIAIIAEKHELSKTKAKAIVDDVFAEIVDAVAKDVKVQLIGFGNFELRERSARTGRNPQTGETLKIAATKAPAFKAGKAFKDAVK